MHYLRIMNDGGYQMLHFDWSICVTWACIISGHGIIGVCAKLHAGESYDVCAK